MKADEVVATRVTLDIAGQERHEVDEGCTIEHYLRQHGCRPQSMIARLNGTIVANPAVCFPKAGDCVEADYRLRGA